MMRFLAGILLLGMLAGVAEAACDPQERETATGYETLVGSCTTAEEVLIQTADSRNFDACFVMSTEGSVEVLASIDGEEYSDALALSDETDVDDAQVAATTAGKMYSFASKFRRLQVRQVGATAATAHMVCWKY